jgi:hypothetical protein
MKKDHSGMRKGSGRKKIRNQGEATNRPCCEKIPIPTTLYFLSNGTFSGYTDPCSSIPPLIM